MNLSIIIKKGLMYIVIITRYRECSMYTAGYNVHNIMLSLIGYSVHTHIDCILSIHDGYSSTLLRHTFDGYTCRLTLLYTYNGLYTV